MAPEVTRHIAMSAPAAGRAAKNAAVVVGGGFVGLSSAFTFRGLDSG